MPTRQEAADELRTGSAAVRLSFQWWTSGKSLDARHKNQIATTFDADVKSLTAGKKLFDTKDPAYAALVRIKGEITETWKQSTLPYVEDGVRLIPRSRIPDFDATVTGLARRFSEAVEALAENYQDIKAKARERLGVLYNEADYPEDVRAKFGFSWDYPNTDPPQYLMTLNPELYEQEQQRVRARFEEATALAEQAFAEQLASLTEHLAERLAPGADGTKKVFRNSAIESFKDFFANFRSLSVRSNSELDQLVQRAEQVMTGVDADALRSDADARARVQASLEQLRGQLEPLVANQSRRTWRRTESAHADPAESAPILAAEQPTGEPTGEKTEVADPDEARLEAEGEAEREDAEQAAIAPATCPHGVEARVADFCMDCSAELEAEPEAEANTEEAAGAAAGGAA